MKAWILMQSTMMEQIKDNDSNTRKPSPPEQGLVLKLACYETQAA